MSTFAAKQESGFDGFPILFIPNAPKITVGKIFIIIIFLLCAQQNLYKYFSAN